MIKKIIINLAIVAAVIIVLDFAIGKVLRFFYFKEMSGIHFRTTNSMEKITSDILVFGSSTACHHYVPEIFENSLKMSFYNAGKAGTGVFFQTAVLKSVLKRYTPKIIIFDFTNDFTIINSSYDQVSLLPYYNSHKEIRNIVELNSPFEKVKLMSEIYPFNSQMIIIAIENLETTNISHENKGYVPLYDEWQTEIDSISNSDISQVDSDRISFFHECIIIAKKSGANVYVVNSPIFQKYDKCLGLNICNQICNLENIPFWDFSKDTTFLHNKHLFKDVFHLNHNGAIIFSNLIVEKIKFYLNKTCSKALYKP